jgi:hypothetical protein
MRSLLLLIVASFVFATSAVAGTRHLMLDPAFIASNEGAQLKVNPPLRRDLVIRPDRPWEKLMISFYLSVLEEDGKLRMWYSVRDTPKTGGVAYAESTDGIHWTKPDLAIVEFDGSKTNNRVNLNSSEGSVFRDDHATDPQQRYIYLCTVFKGGGAYRFHSPDGFNWQRDAAPLFPFEADSQNVTFWDQRLGRYMLFFRGWNISKPFGLGRKVVHIETESLERPLNIVPTNKGKVFKNEPERDPLIVDEMPTVLVCDERDPPDTDIYTNAMQPYPLAPEWYVGFPAFYRHTTKSKLPADGRTELQFVASGDHGRSWQRYDRATYVSPGFAGSENANMVYMGPGLIVRGDEIWQYGTGYRTSHGDTPGRVQRTDGAIYRYVQRVDGFVSLDFPAGGAHAVLAPVVVDGDTLRLNLDTGALGEARVGLRNAAGEEIAGFGEKDCDALQLNATGAIVTWKGNRDLSALRGQPVRIAIAASRTKFYSLRFE